MIHPVRTVSGWSGLVVAGIGHRLWAVGSSQRPTDGRVSDGVDNEWPNHRRTVDANHSRLADNADTMATKPRKYASERLGLVSSYAIRWDRAATDWPNLYAIRTIGRRTIHANFRNQMGLYILYERNQPQYVGIADRLGD
jgi:hypothetical protein